MDLNAHGGDVTFLKFARDVALDEGGLADAAVADEHDLKGGDILCLGSHGEAGSGDSLRRKEQ